MTKFKGLGTVCCTNGNGLSGYIKGMEFVWWLVHYGRLEKECTVGN